jgi:hypothetical protein
MSDVAKWNLRGPVQAMRSEVADWDPDRGVWQAPRGASTVTFRLDGQVSARESYNPNGPVARWAHVYDADGRMIEEQFWKDDGPRTRGVYSYDARGRHVATEVFDPDGTGCETERCRYDSAGRKTKIIFLLHLLPRERPDIRGIHYGVEGSEYAVDAPGAVTLTVTYDDHGRSTEGSFHTADGKLVRRMVLSRDADGRLLAEVVLLEGEVPFPLPAADNRSPEEHARMAAELKLAFPGQVLCKAAYAYDTRGRLLERTSYMGSLSEERTIFEYADEDDPIAEHASSRNYRVELDDAGVVRTTEEEPRVEQHNRYGYRYDSRGNWTERVVSYRIGSQLEFRRSSIERRGITYYGET